MAVHWLSTGGAILCFHSLTTPELPAEVEVHVSAHFFASALNLARRLAEIVPLRVILERYQEGKSTTGLIAITCDDAYATLLAVGGELIRKEGVPLTVFVVTDAALSAGKYWWDRIEDTFPRVPRALWRQFESRCGVPESFRRGQPSEFGPLRPLRQWILHHYKGRWPQELEPALAELERECGFTTPHRSMSFEEIERLISCPTVDIGVHTVSHPVLPLLSDEQVIEEARACYKLLRERFAVALPVMAIPYGLFDRRTARLAREAGMSSCLALGSSGIDLWHRSDGVVPRFCMSRGDRLWKLGLRLTGLTDRLQGRFGQIPPRYPDLPSFRT